MWWFTSLCKILLKNRWSAKNLKKSPRLSFWDGRLTFSIDPDGQYINTNRKSMRWAFHFIFVELWRTKLATLVIYSRSRVEIEPKSPISRKRLFQRTSALSRWHRPNSGFPLSTQRNWTMCSWNSKGSSQLLDLHFQFLIQRSTEIPSDPPCRWAPHDVFSTSLD